MKKFLTFLLIFILLFTFSSCQVEEEKALIIDEEFSALYSQNSEFIVACEDIESISNFLMRWAKDIEDVKVSYDSYGNIIMSKKATTGYEKAPSTIFQTTLSLTNKDQTTLSITVLMHILSKSEEHGFIRVLFTSENGIEKVKKSYLSGDNFISLDFNANNNLIIGSAGLNKYTVTKDITYHEASYPNAFKLQIDNTLPDDSDIKTTLNPLKVIGNLLAKCKSEGLLFELAEFSGGTSYDTYPKHATAIVLVNDNDMSKFKKRVEKSISDTLDDFGDENITYTFEPVEFIELEKVISSDDTGSLIGFIYTSLYGVYNQSDDGEIMAFSNLGSFELLEDKCVITLCSQSKSEDTLTELDNSMEILCGLYDMTYNCENINPIWTLDMTDNVFFDTLFASMTEILEKEPKLISTFDTNACTKVLKRNPNLNAACFCISENKLTKQTEALLLYLKESQAPDTN